eukprot:523033-Amorphochlora_amoeboformis.AAC.1
MDNAAAFTLKAPQSPRNEKFSRTKVRVSDCLHNVLVAGLGAWRPRRDEIIMLEKLLEEAKNRKNTVPEEPPSSYNGPSFNVQTYNAISPVGLQKFPEGKYKVGPFISVNM